MILPVLQEFKYPCCDGAIEFVARAQQMKCPYCDSEFEIEDLRAYEAQLRSQPQDSVTWDTAPGTEWSAGDTKGLRLYTCNTCGGEIVADETSGAAECPFCRNPNVYVKSGSGGVSVTSRQDLYRKTLERAGAFP